MWEGIELAGLSLIGEMNYFKQYFIQEPDSDATLKAVFEGSLGALSGLLGMVPGAGPAAGAALAFATPGLKEAVFREGSDDPLKDFDDALGLWAEIQKQLKLHLADAHSAFFSNGVVGDDGQAKGYAVMLPGFLRGGALLDAEAYASGIDVMGDTMKSVLSIKLIEAALKAKNSFMIFIDKVSEESCKGWKKGHAYADTYCAPEGMYFLVSVTEAAGGRYKVDSPQGWFNMEEETWGKFGYEKSWLMHSVAAAYQERGLTYNATVEDYANIRKRTREKQSVHGEKGIFNMPICWICYDSPKENNWWQSDYMDKDWPPIDCRCRDDGKGNLFYNHPDLSNVTKAWLDGAVKEGNCPSFQQSRRWGQASRSFAAAWVILVVSGSM